MHTLDITRLIGLAISIHILAFVLRFLLFFLSFLPCNSFFRFVFSSPSHSRNLILSPSSPMTFTPLRTLTSIWQNMIISSQPCTPTLDQCHNEKQVHEQEKSTISTSGSSTSTPLPSPHFKEYQRPISPANRLCIEQMLETAVQKPISGPSW